MADAPGFAFRLPDGRSRDDSRLTFSSKVQVEITAREPGNLDPDADPIIIPIGVGWSALLVQARQCGDVYVELEGRTHVSATGKTNVDALRAALAKAA